MTSHSRRRYYIIHLPACTCLTSTTDSERANCLCQHRSAMHSFARDYFAVRVNNSTLVGIATFHNSSKLASARGHANLLVLPHLNDKTSVKSLLQDKGKKHEHWQSKHAALKHCCPLDDSDVTADFIGKMLSAGHNFLEPEF